MTKLASSDLPSADKPMVVVFDMDDTLYPEAAFVLSALAEVGVFAQQEWGYAGFGEELQRLFQAGYRQDLFQLAARRLGLVALADEQVAKMLSVYRNHRPAVLPWHRDALDLVMRLHGRHPMALISDGFLPVQRNKAEALGVGRWIPSLVFTEELGREHWKPSPVAFSRVMALHPGRRFVYVADNPAKDFVGPRGLGWMAVQVRRSDGQYASAQPPSGGEPHHVISELSDLDGLL